MIRKPHDWENVQAFSDRPSLPLSAYICKIRKAVIQPTNYGEQLCVLFDISEGLYTGFYNTEYNNNPNADKRWKGVLRVFLPADDGTERDETSKRLLKGFVTSVEKSNPGYTFDWNEATLSGKSIGILYRREEWDYAGKTGWTVRPYRAMSVDSVRNGDFTLPKDRPLSSATKRTVAPQSASASFSEMDDDDVPF